ncbi:hypothetical protein Btru_038680 [Bulinus truncatus]|nr:hypothetical protein Btru_038680 [Bulinus truncatus]
MDLFRSLLTLVYVESIVSTTDVDNDSVILLYDRLRNDLLRRPAMVHRMPAVTCKSTSPFVLNFKMTLVQVVQVDQIEQLMTIVGLFDIEWMHGGLTWDPTIYSGLDSVNMYTEEMWTPQLAIWIGDRDSTTFAYPDTLTLNASGFVSCTTQSYITFRCTINVRKFPFDTQTCNFAPYFIDRRTYDQARSLSLTGYSDLQSGLSNDSPYNIKGEWTLQNFTVETFREYIKQGTPIYVLTVRRQRQYYVIVVIFPMVVTSIMIPLVFLIPENSGEKMSYLMTIYTSSAIFLSYIRHVMPKNLSTTTPYLAILLTEVISLGLFATLAALCVINKYNTDDQQRIFENNMSTTDKKNMSIDVKMATREKIQRQEKQEFQTGDMRSAEKVVMNKTRLTGSQLDWFFFCIFFTGQTVFLVSLFFGTEWLD